MEVMGVQRECEEEREEEGTRGRTRKGEKAHGTRRKVPLRKNVNKTEVGTSIRAILVE
jgi:hypothetical protein